MLRLEEHRRVMEAANYLGPLLRVEELDPPELEIINRNFLELCRRERAEDISQIYSAYVRTLHEWGVMCPHPQPQRLYGGWHRSLTPVPFEEIEWYECNLCNAAVINR